MSWVTESLRQREKASAPAAKTPIPAQVAPSQTTWNKVSQVIEADVLEFNAARGPQYTVSSNSVIVQVVPKQPPTDLAIFQLDPNGVIQVTCPISHPGLPRRGQFKIKGDHIISSGDFVGQPQPPSEPMTPEQFSECILKPLLFPE